MNNRCKNSAHCIPIKDFFLTDQVLRRDDDDDDDVDRTVASQEQSKHA